MQPESREVQDKVFSVALEALLQLYKAVSAAMHVFQVNIHERFNLIWNGCQERASRVIGENAELSYKERTKDPGLFGLGKGGLRRTPYKYFRGGKYRESR